MSKKQKHPVNQDSTVKPPQQHPPKRGKQTQTGLWESYKPWWLLAGIVGFTILVLFPTLKADFVNWDDDIYITENPLLVHLSENLKTFFTEPIASNYHPLTILSLALDYQLVGMKPFWYHFVNLLFHLFNTVLVFLFIKRLSSNKTNVALIVALLFAIHPMHLESVAWISERKDVLYTFFFLLSLIFYLRHLDTPKISLLALSLFLFILSALSKPAAVTLPVVLVLIDWYLNKKLTTKTIIEKVPFFLVALIIGYVTWVIQAKTAISDFGSYTIPQRFMFAAYGSVMYIVKLFVPYNLAVLHPYPALNNGLPIIYYITFVVALGLLAAVVWSLRHTKVVAFGAMFYLINVALVLQFVSVGMAIISERYTYVPYIGLCFILAMGYHYYTTQKPQMATPLLAVLLGFVGIMSIVTFNRTAVWQNSDVLWTDVINKYPDKSPVAYNNRGNYFRNDNQQQKALADFNKAISLLSDYQLAYVNRGNVYFTLNRNEEAIKDYNKGIELKPDDAKAYCNRSAVQFQLGQYDKAIEDASKALELKPIYPDAWLNRSVTYAVLNKHKEAVEDFDNYINYKDDNAKMYNWRGISLRALGKQPEALLDFNKAIQMDGKNGEFYLNRSYTHNELRNRAQALADAQKAKSLGYKVEDSYLQNLNQN